LVEVERASTRGRLSLIEGSFRLGDKRYRFSGIVVMTLGGPSVGISLAEKSEEELRRDGLTQKQIDEVVAEVQRRIVEGDFRMVGEVEFVEDK
jgi:hypothetical protein